MKTGIITKEVAYAAFQGVLLFPVFPAAYSSQTHDLFNFQEEKIQNNCRRNDRFRGYFPPCISLRVMSRSVHTDFTGHLRPVFNEKEAWNQKNTRF